MGDKESEFHVLVVDPIKTDRKNIKTLFESLFFQVTAVESGTEALDFLESCEFGKEYIGSSVDDKATAVNMIITHYYLPEMTGIFLLKKIKESPFLRNIPVIMMSSDIVTSRITRCLKKGASKFLVKPLTVSDVNVLRPLMIKINLVHDHRQVAEKQVTSASNCAVELNDEIETSDNESQFHVLVVDHSKLDRKMVEDLLKCLSFQVTAVDSGIKALEFLSLCESGKAMEVDLIITDYCMPEMTGYKLLMKIQESQYLIHIPVVIMSSGKVPSRITSCLEGGAVEFLVKPLTVSAMKILRPIIIKAKLVKELYQVPGKQETSASMCAVESNLEIKKGSKESEFHVLVVDDSTTDRELVESMLKTSSFQVTTVDSGKKALEFLTLCEDKKPMEVNLIITDFCMPGMTGYELLKKLKKSPSLKNIPVVVMSSMNVPARIMSWVEEGAEDFFLKPVKLSDVDKLRPIMVKAKQVQNLHASEKQESSGSTSD